MHVADRAVSSAGQHSCDTPGVSATPAVEVHALSKRYGRTVAVDSLSFVVPAGSVTALLGPNGAGKTTTVECCEGYRRPDSGYARVLGLDPVHDGAALRPRVGVMLQEGGGMYPAARAAELLHHLANLHAHPLDVGALMERLGLGPAGRTPVRRLSGGQRQQVALAAALVGRPELVFLDEPTSGLDPRARMAAWELVRNLRSDGVTVVLTTHLMDEAEHLIDRVVIVDRGRRVAEGSPSELTGAAGFVRFDAPVGLDLASLRTVLPTATTVEEIAPGRYRVQAPVTPELVASVTSWCASRGVLPKGLQLGHRTLEDVFLQLTGEDRP
jgi:ABC-2 type transport system ATP-binding protein